ncbi:MAG TPA: hypothetical protein VF310_06985, partial [Vicinamibacteria bacterium]
MSAITQAPLPEPLVNTVTSAGARLGVQKVTKAMGFEAPAILDETVAEWVTPITAEPVIEARFEALMVQYDP